MNDIRFYIWVTSDCNLSCRLCSQRYTMDQNKGYHMSMDEVSYIVDSCKSRGIRFNVIELTGGEASMWNNLEEGYKLFSEICNNITMVTNGNDPKRVISLGMKEWIVSSSQASEFQLKKYKDNPHVLYNAHAHKRMPEMPIKHSLPAKCCVRYDPHWTKQTAMEYIRGMVWFCCDAYAHTERVKATDDIVCDFEDDFVIKFSEPRDYHKAICSYCLCNRKVWNKV